MPSLATQEAACTGPSLKDSCSEQGGVVRYGPGGLPGFDGHLTGWESGRGAEGVNRFDDFDGGALGGPSRGPILTTRDRGWMDSDGGDRTRDCDTVA